MCTGLGVRPNRTIAKVRALHSKLPSVPSTTRAIVRMTASPTASVPPCLRLVGGLALVWVGLGSGRDDQTPLNTNRSLGHVRAPLLVLSDIGNTLLILSQPKATTLVEEDRSGHQSRQSRTSAAWQRWLFNSL